MLSAHDPIPIVLRRPRVLALRCIEGDQFRRVLRWSLSSK